MKSKFKFISFLLVFCLLMSSNQVNAKTKVKSKPKKTATVYSQSQNESSSTVMVSNKKNSYFNVAVIDLPRVFENYPKVAELNKSRSIQVEGLVSFAENARKEVEKEKNVSKKKKLEDSYNLELNKKKELIDKEFAQKLREIDSELSSIVSQYVATNNYDLILAKSVVVRGGIDITDEIIGLIKSKK